MFMCKMFVRRKKNALKKQMPLHRRTTAIEQVNRKISAGGHRNDPGSGSGWQIGKPDGPRDEQMPGLPRAENPVERPGAQLPL